MHIVGGRYRSTVLYFLPPPSPPALIITVSFPINHG